MKTMAGILIVALALGGIAVKGSRAATLPASSIAHQQCYGAESQPARCVPMGPSLLLAMEDRGDLGLSEATGQLEAADIGVEAASATESPEFMREIFAKAAERAVRAGVGVLAAWAVDRLVDAIFGGARRVEPTEEVAQELFDPDL